MLPSSVIKWRLVFLILLLNTSSIKTVTLVELFSRLKSSCAHYLPCEERCGFFFLVLNFGAIFGDTRSDEKNTFETVIVESETLPVKMSPPSTVFFRKRLRKNNCICLSRKQKRLFQAGINLSFKGRITEIP